MIEFPFIRPARTDPLKASLHYVGDEQERTYHLRLEWGELPHMDRVTISFADLAAVERFIETIAAEWDRVAMPGDGCGPAPDAPRCECCRSLGVFIGNVCRDCIMLAMKADDAQQYADALGVEDIQHRDDALVDGHAPAPYGGYDETRQLFVEAGPDEMPF